VVGEASGRECKVLNVSAGGAKLIMEIAPRIGTKFYLSASPNAARRKQCVVIWRRSSTVGIKFLSEFRSVN
jgi:hypothetical protein